AHSRLLANTRLTVSQRHGRWVVIWGRARVCCDDIRMNSHSCFLCKLLIKPYDSIAAIAEVFTAGFRVFLSIVFFSPKANFSEGDSIFHDGMHIIKLMNFYYVKM